VVKLLLCLLSEEALKLRTKLGAARQILVAFSAETYSPEHR
jgi:hypothetical protein